MENSNRKKYKKNIKQKAHRAQRAHKAEIAQKDESTQSFKRSKKVVRSQNSPRCLKKDYNNPLPKNIKDTAYLFVCTNKTLIHIEKYKIFGLPEHNREDMKKKIKSFYNSNKTPIYLQQI